MTAEDFIIQPAWMLPVVPAGQVLSEYSIRVTAGRIAAIGPAEQLRQQWPQLQVVDLPRHVLFPGLINMHTHSAMSLFRGYADDLPLQTWLQQHIWPAEAELVGPEFVTAGSELGLAEMIRGGTTCFNDNYFFPNVTAAAAVAAGMRAVVGIPIINQPTAWARDDDEYFQRGQELQQSWAEEALVNVTLAPHAPYSVNDGQLARIREISQQGNLRVHMHLLETPWDNEHSQLQHGISALERLDKYDLLNEDLLAVHMTTLKGGEIQLLAERGVHVIHCPESNLKLASGFCPVAQLMDAGVNVCLGTDGAASNNDLDLLGELKTAALLAKGVSTRPEAVDASTALEMVTINAARALGMAGEIGSIEVGKAADLAALDITAVNTQPVHNVISQLVYAANASQVSHVWVRGRELLRQGVLTSLDQDAITARASQWQRRMAAIHADETVEP